MRRIFVHGIAVVSVVCSSASCSDSPSSVPPATSGAQQQATPAGSTTSSECSFDMEQLPLKIFLAPKEEALEPKAEEYSADYDDHAEPVWLLAHVRLIDDAFITGTLTEGSNHVPAFDDGKARFYRRSQWRCP